MAKVLAQKTPKRMGCWRTVWARLSPMRGRSVATGRVGAKRRKDLQRNGMAGNGLDHSEGQKYCYNQEQDKHHVSEVLRAADVVAG